MPGARRVVPLEGVGTGADGPACLYVLPCAYEDFAKLGIARDPLQRMHAFSSRYYEFFDLGRGWLAEADSVREARQWETRLKRALRDHAAPAPLLVPGEAAGHTEWFRGAQPALEQARDDLVRQGFVVHGSLRDWVMRRLRAHREHLESGERAAVARFGPIDAWPAAASDPALSRVRDALDAYGALELELDDAVSPGLLAWLRRNSLSPR